MTNPLFPDDVGGPAKPDAGYVLPRGKERVIQPVPGAASYDPDASHETHTGASEAADLIRRKIDALYAKEPNAKQESHEAATAAPRSKHQQFMYELSTSGKSLAQIQTAWHNYYVALPDDEKHAVWQEFYAANSRQPSAYTQFAQQRGAVGAMAQRYAQASAQTDHGPAAFSHKGYVLPTAESNAQEHATPPFVGVNPSTDAVMGTVGAAMVQTLEHHRAKRKKPTADSFRTAAAMRKQVLKKVRLSAAAQKKARQHAQSLLFGIASGSIVLIVVLFSFFNEVIITPFIQPSRHVNATPVILSSSDITPGSAPEVIIPKINVEIPVDYNLTTDDEATVENALEGGVVHYASTVVPGQAGNTALFGHSSNNIFNPGKYKFAFVLLHTLVPGDIFYLTYNGTVYTYKVYDKQIVDPSDVAVLDNVPGKTATTTLITCDPPGTSMHRLVVWGEQISPDPSGNTAGTPKAAAPATTLASNGPSLWSRLTHWLF